ncbi:MAG: DUF4282 domain-containing protein [Candidatus Zixiibacteriota bacterium]
MDSKLVQQIRKTMELKSTEELLQIQREDDRSKYSDEAFEAIRLLLTERGQIVKTQPSSQNEVVRRNEGGGYFAFRKMVSFSLIKIIYALGMIGMTIAGIFLLIPSAQNRNDSGGKFLIGLVLIILGNLVWRIICETWILLFSMHEILGSIDRELKKK